jgi:hypothetical protein
MSKSEKLMQALVELLSVKSLVTIALIGTVVVLALRQNVVLPSEFVVAVVTSIVTYFFTKQSNKNP